MSSAQIKVLKFVLAFGPSYGFVSYSGGILFAFAGAKAKQTPKANAKETRPAVPTNCGWRQANKQNQARAAWAAFSCSPHPCPSPPHVIVFPLPPGPSADGEQLACKWFSPHVHVKTFLRRVWFCGTGSRMACQYLHACLRTETQCGMPPSPS